MFLVHILVPKSQVDRPPVVRGMVLPVGSSGSVMITKRCKKKHEKYSETLSRLTWLNGCLNGLNVASGILSVATLSMFIGFPVSIPLGAVFLAGASVSGVATALAKKY